MNLMEVLLGKFQHLCWTPEGDGHVGQAGALG